jgi:hypothetical protein
MSIKSQSGQQPLANEQPDRFRSGCARHALHLLEVLRLQADNDLVFSHGDPNSTT